MRTECPGYISWTEGSPHCLLLEIFTNKGIGTAILDESEEKLLSWKANEIMEKAENYVLHTYNRYPVVLDHGEGVRLYDMEGKEYLDFAAGIAVFALGYEIRNYDETLKAQIDKLIHTSNLYYNEPAGRCSRKTGESQRDGQGLLYQQRNGGHRGGAESGQKICLSEGRTQ